MNLDPRIKDYNHICNPFSAKNLKLNEKGYFSNVIEDFSNLKNCYYGTLISVNDDVKYPYCKNDDYNDDYRFKFYIPEKVLNSKEKNYRPFTIEEFENKHYFDIVVFRKKKGNVELHSRYNGYTYSKERGFDVLLGCEYFSFEELFNNYELRDSDGNWKPFGVEE